MNIQQVPDKPTSKIEDASNIVIVHEPLIHEYGPNKVAILLAEELRRKGFNVYIVGQECSERIGKKLSAMDIGFIKIGKRRCLTCKREEKAFEIWLRDNLFPYSLKELNALLNGGIVINTSTMLAFPSTFWYAQGPVSRCLSSIITECPAHYRLICFALKPLISIAEKSFLSRIMSSVRVMVANSKYCASLYEAFGLKIQRIIYPPFDGDVFRPTTPRPSADYVLTYFGKETLWAMIKSIADKGVKIKAFGGKVETTPKALINHENIEHVGWVSDGKLADLYSNALFTLFTYSHEPFGYVPVESMACGTPVLTLQGQGPAESVIHEHTGWLCKSKSEIVEYTLKIWRDGYPSHIRTMCRERATAFDRRRVAEEWLELFRYVV